MQAYVRLKSITPALWILAGCASALVTMTGSRAAIVHATVVAACSGHGDINPGDATGAVFTLITLGFGLFPCMAGFAIVDAPLAVVANLVPGSRARSATYGRGRPRVSLTRQ